MEYQLDDIVKMRKTCHSCNANKWRIIRMGADIRIKCLECGHSVLMPRSKFEEGFVNKYKPMDIIKSTKNDEEIERNIKIYKDTQIGDKVFLKEHYKCPNMRNHLNSDTTFGWKVVQVMPLVVLKCDGCRCQIKLNFDEYVENLKTNKSLNKRNNKKRKKEQKEELMNQKELIEKDKEYQEAKFNKLLKHDDVVMLEENMKCPQCDKQFYKIVDIPKLVTEPVTLICASCNDIKKNKYTLDMQVMTKKEEFYEINNIISNTIYKKFFRYSSNKDKLITCPNCGNEQASFVQTSYFPVAYSIKCSNCEQSKKN